MTDSRRPLARRCGDRRRTAGWTALLFAVLGLSGSAEAQEIFLIPPTLLLPNSTG